MYINICNYLQYIDLMFIDLLSLNDHIGCSCRTKIN